MSGPARGQRSASGSIALGVMRLARGRADGLQQFGATREAFLGSLAPLIAFPLVGGALMLMGGGGLAALADLLATLCALVAPPVLSFEVARLWGRDALWLRYATAFNWCQWAIPILGSVLMVVLGVMAAFGLPPAIARWMVVLGLVTYGMWLHWFLARHGLGLSGSRAALLVVGVNVVTVLLVLGPRVLLLAVGGGGLEGK